MITNNFKFIYGSPTIEKSEYIIRYKTILGFIVYKVSFNGLVYVVFDEVNNRYYNIERVGGSPEEVDLDLEVNIKMHIQ